VAATRRFNEGGFGGGDEPRSRDLDERNNYDEGFRWQNEYSGRNGNHGRGGFSRDTGNRFEGNFRGNFRGGRGTFRGGRGGAPPNRFRPAFDGGFRNRGGDNGIEKGKYALKLIFLNESNHSLYRINLYEITLFFVTYFAVVLTKDRRALLV